MKSFVSQSDAGLASYLTQVEKQKDLNASMVGYNVSLQGSITGLHKVSDALKQYNALGNSSVQDQKEFATAVGLTNSNLSSYLTGLNGSNASIIGYGMSLAGATLKTVGLTAATIALNAALSFGISAIVTGAITVVTSLINKSEEVANKAQEASDKIKSINDNLKSNTKTVENVKSRYAELAQEVENLGNVNQNQGDLNTEEYEEFLNLSNQLSGVFPTLTKGYDENGNAILNLSGDVDTIVGSLNNLLEKEKELANQEIMKEFPDVLKGYSQDVSNAKNEVQNAQKEFDSINEAYYQLKNGFSIFKDFNADGTNNEDKIKINEYVGFLKTLGLGYEQTIVQNGNESGYRIIATGDITDAHTSKLETARKNLQYAQENLENQSSSINSYLNTWLSGNSLYKGIKDDGLKIAIQETLFNFDWDTLPEDIAKKFNNGDWDAVSSYLERNILSSIKNINDDEISKTLSDIYIGDLSSGELLNAINKVTKYFGENDPISLSLKSKADEIRPLITEIENKLNETKYKDSKINFDEIELDELEVAATISTEEFVQAIEDEEKALSRTKKELEDSGLDKLIGEYDHALKVSEDYVDSLDDIYKSYNGINNIDRDMIIWDDKTLENNRQFLEEQYGSFEEAVDNLKGSWSTVLGTSENVKGVEIAYTQMLQTDHGLVALTEDTFWDYFNNIFDKSWNEDGTFNAEKFIQLDSQGTKMLVNGQMENVANMIAAAEGQYLNGIKLTADDVIAIGSPGYDDNGNDLLPGNNSIFKGHSMHEVQAEALWGDYAFENLAKKCAELGMTVQEAWDKDIAVEYWNSAANALNKYIQAQQALDYTVDFSPSSAFNSLKQALEEQESQGYLTNKTLQSLKNTYGDLSDMILYTANGVRLNSKSMFELTEQKGQAALVNTQLKEAKAVQDRENAVNELNRKLKDYSKTSKLSEKETRELNEATKKGTSATLEAIDAIDSLTDAQKKSLKLDIDKIDSLNSEINKFDELEQSIYASISAINLYKQAKETANASDNYNYVQSEIETNEKAYENGLTKTDEFQQWMKYIGSFNQSLEYSDQQIQTYMTRAKRYFTENADGLFNWLDDASEKSQGMITKLEDGSYNIDITDVNLLSKYMDQSVSAVTDILLRMSETSGFNLDFSNISDSLISGIQNLPTDVYEARTSLDEYKKVIDKLKEAGYDATELEEQYEATYNSIHPELNIKLGISSLSEDDLLSKALEVVDDVQSKLGDTDIELNLESESIDDIENQLSALSYYIDGIDVKVNPDDYQNALIVMKQLLDQKHQLEISQTPVMNVDVSQLEGDIQTAIAAIQQYIQARQQLENAELGVIDMSVEDAQAELNSVISTLSDNMGALYTLGITVNPTINAEKFDEQIALITDEKIASLSEGTTDINIGGDTTQLDKDLAAAKNRISQSKANIKIGANTSNLVTDIREYLSDKNFNITVNANVVTSGGSSSGGKKNPVSWMGSAHAQGTWNVGNRAGKNTLVGEIAPEIWVHDGVWETVGDNGAEFITTHPDDIIFNHKQSEQILKYGKLNSRGRIIGGSFVNGSAFNLSSTGTVVSRNDYDKYRGGSSSSSSGSSSSSSSSNSNDSSEETKEIFDWIERKIKDIERDIENLDQTASAAYKGWSERNSKLNSEISKITEEIDIQQQAYERYMNEADSVGLSDSYKKLVQDGKIDIETITDEDLKEQINDYQNWYDKAIDCYDAVQDLNDTIAELAQQKFDNLVKQFEDLNSVIEHTLDLLDGVADQIETEGYIVSDKVYQAIKVQQENQLSQETSHLASLKEAFNTALSEGKIVEGSEAYYEMLSEIQSCEKEIQDLNTSIAETNNKIREVPWTIFEKLQEQIGAVNDEAEFYMNLMSSEKMFDEDTASITNEGMATLGLHGVKYNTFMAQADEYTEAIKELDEQIANDPYNQTLIDKRNDWIEKYREAAEAAKSEKDAIKDLVSEGFDAFLNVLDEAIQKRKDLLDLNKDVYDYEKNISEQTKNIANLQKQLNAYSGDNSESTQAKIQELQESLNEAQENLQETEYDRYIEDQTKILDDLRDDTEEWLNSRLDDMDSLLQGVIDSINNNSGNIEDTLKEYADSVGTSLSQSMSTIWSTDSGIGQVIQVYSENSKNALTTVNESLNDIRNYINSLRKDSDKKADEKVNNPTGVKQDTPKKDTTQKPQQEQPVQQPDKKENTISVGGQINAGNATIYATSSGTGGGEQYFANDPIYNVLGEQNGYVQVRWHKATSGVTGWFKKSDVKAYKTGGLNTETGIAWLDGTKSKPEAVLNADETQAFLELTDVFKKVEPKELLLNKNLIESLKGSLSDIQPFTQFAGRQAIPYAVKPMEQNLNIQIGDIHMNGVNNPEAFATELKHALQTNKTIAKIIQTDTLGVMTGKNSLGKLRF